MKKFLELIEIAKRDGLTCVSDAGDVSRINADDAFWKTIENCHPFVFSPVNKEPVDLGDDEAGGLLKQDLDAPFKVFSIEVLGQHITVPRPDDKLKMWIDCIVVVEVRPKEFAFVTLCELMHDFKSSRMVFSSNAEWPIVRAYLKRLKREMVGVEHIRERVKIGTGSSKRVATFRKIVHVRPKKMLELAGDPQSRNIDWTHRWAVRGHWREVAGLGKDRDGNYCVEGMTWVSEYEKGPEDAPLVKKTRLVTG